MNCARNCENLLNFVKVIPKTLLVPFIPDTVYFQLNLLKDEYSNSLILPICSSISPYKTKISPLGEFYVVRNPWFE